MSDSPIAEVRRILEEAEAKICELVKRSARNRDYARLQQLTELAQQVKDLGEEFDDDGADEEAPTQAPTGATPSSTFASARRNSPNDGESESASHEDVTLFSRDGGDLVMTLGGLEHSRASQAAIEAVTSYLEVLEDEPPIAEFISCIKRLGGSGIGDDEIGVVVTWLTGEGFIIKSRHGTVFATESGAALRSAVEEVWDFLPSEE